ncbi:MAG TPA: type II toxin-antitoxin system VapC family toxin [Thermoanaerobaculia bacterium]|nr:type II toxin-antitoxin system VapC family toxin [Thermoanaerobaculia bacterium]
MKLYAESSAVLSWLLREGPAVLLKEILERAELVVASELTLVECDRALIRAEAMGELSQFEMAQRRALLEAVSARWLLLKLGGEIVQRARRRFPQEPVRSLDSLHLASALTVRSTLSDLTLLSLDQRVRDNGAALGFDVLPG